MKRFILISLALSIAGLLVYFVWQYYHPKEITTWDLVPHDALAVYEHHAASNETTGSLLTLSVGDSIRKSILPIKELLISFHRTTKEEIAPVIYVRGTVAEKLASQFRTRKNARARMFEGFQIIDLPSNRPHAISAVMIDRVFVISNASLMIEDVIRLSKSDKTKGFALSNPQLFKFTRMEWNGGRIYVNFSRLPEILDIFAQRDSKLFSNFSGPGIVDIKTQSGNLSFSGFVGDSISQKPSFLSLFNHQQPVPMTVHRVVSARTGWVVQYGISNIDAWLKDRSNFETPPGFEAVNNKIQTSKFDVTTFYHNLGNEWALSQGGVLTGSVYIVKIRNEKSELELNKASREIEFYSRRSIRVLPLPNFCARLFSPLTNMDLSYYASVNGYLMFANELDDLKIFIDDVETDNTWGKSSEWNKFIAGTQETNLGIVFDAWNAWPSMRGNFRPRWQRVGDTSRFFSLRKGSVQLSRLETSYSLNGSLQFDAKRSKGESEKEKFQTVTLSSQLVYPLTAVKNHNDGSTELITQDADNHLLLFSSSLKPLFNLPLESRIRSAITQVDYYRNKKLQYLFATDKNIWLVDRLGNPVKGFPWAIPVKDPLTSFAVVDTERKGYQVLLTDQKGLVSKYQANGASEPNWKLLQLNNDIWAAPRATRLGGMDVILVVTKKGTLYCVKSTGEMVSGFPVDLKINPSGSLTLQKQDDSSLITLVGIDGVLVQVSDKGTIVTKNHLIKSSAASRFALTASENSETAVISRIDREKLSVLNLEGEVIFEHENPGSEDMFLTYFALPRDKKIFVFTDPQQEFSYYFDSKGESIFSKPLENQQKPEIASDKSGNTYFYGVNQNQIQNYKRSRLR